MDSTLSETDVVSRFEFNLLRILQFLLRRGRAAQALPLLFTKLSAPLCLSRHAVQLIQDTLAKGCISLLARAAGWWHERHLHDGTVREGQLWQRHALTDVQLTFSKNTLRFLLWLTAANPKNRRLRWPSLPEQQWTLGDELFLYFTFGSLRDTEAWPNLCSRRVFVRNAPCRLCWPGDFATSAVNQLPDFSRWTNGIGAAALEALQPELARGQVDFERSKTELTDWRVMQRFGRLQESSLTAFLDAVETAERYDLARFLFAALHELLPERPQLQWWTRQLNVKGARLAERAETGRAALMLVQHMRRMKSWEQQARAVAYFDDNYAAWQLYKTDWERWRGEDLNLRAQSLLAQVEPI